jgi:hypothetical protein
VSGRARERENLKLSVAIGVASLVLVSIGAFIIERSQRVPTGEASPSQPPATGISRHSAFGAQAHTSTQSDEAVNRGSTAKGRPEVSASFLSRGAEVENTVVRRMEIDARSHLGLSQTNRKAAVESSPTSRQWEPALYSLPFGQVSDDSKSTRYEPKAAIDPMVPNPALAAMTQSAQRDLKTLVDALGQAAIPVP